MRADAGLNGETPKQRLTKSVDGLDANAFRRFEHGGK